MLEIGSADIYLPKTKLNQQDLQIYSEKLFDEWEYKLDSLLNIPDYSVALEVEEGSLSIRGKIAASALALYTGIAQYGSFISGVEKILSQASQAINILTKESVKNHATHKNIPKIKKSGGDLIKIKNITNQYQARKISIEDAMEKISLILESADDRSDEFLEKAKESLTQSPFYPQQSKLDLYTPTQFTNIQEKSIASERKQKNIPTNSPNNNHEIFRIEMWRSSRNEQRNIKIVKVK